jgi:hypothetical protein
LDEREQKLNEREEGFKPQETSLFKLKKDIDTQYRENNDKLDIRLADIVKREVDVKNLGNLKEKIAKKESELKEREQELVDANHNVSVQAELAREHTQRFRGYGVIFSQKHLRRGAYEFFQLVGDGNLTAENWCEIAVQNMSEIHKDWGDYIGYTFFECVAPLPNGVNIDEMKKILLDQIERKVNTKVIFIRQG